MAPCVESLPPQAVSTAATAAAATMCMGVMQSPSRWLVGPEHIRLDSAVGMIDNMLETLVSDFLADVARERRT